MAPHRAGRWTRSQVRDRVKARLTEHPWVALLSVAFFGAMGGILVYALPNPENWFLSGAAVCCAPWTIAFILRDDLGLAGIAMGGAAEEWTSHELRHFARAEGRTARIWHVLDHVLMDGYDIDHILIGPGGVFALETKWSAEGWAKPWPPDRLDSAARKAQNNARHVKSLLRAEAHLLDISVDPLVVLWPSRPAGLRLPERVIFGTTLKEFCTGLESDQLDSDAVSTAAEAIATFMRRRDDYELERRRIGRLRRRWYSRRFDPLGK